MGQTESWWLYMSGAGVFQEKILRFGSSGCEVLIRDHWKRPWCWERLKEGGKGDDRGWDVWMASLTRWTWVWASSGSWWWTGRPGVLQSMGSQSRTRLSDWTAIVFFQVTFQNFRCLISKVPDTILCNTGKLTCPVHSFNTFYQASLLIYTMNRWMGTT